MTVDAKLADGTILRFPDGTDPAVVDAAVKKHLNGGESNRNLKLAGSAVARGLMTPGAFVADLPRIIMKPGQTVKAPGVPGGGIPKSEFRIAPDTPILDFWKKFGTQPTTPKEKLLTSAVEGGSSVLTSGPFGMQGRLPWLLAEGTGAGFGSEAAAQSMGEGPLQRILGALLGGMGTAAPQTFFGNTKDLAVDAMSDVNPLDLDAAQRSMKEGVKEGLPINVSQAMPQPSSLDPLVETLAQTQAGKTTIDQLRRQPALAEIRTGEKIADLPGTARPAQEVANEAQTGATSVMKTVRGERRKAYEDLLGDEGKLNVPQERMKALDDELLGLETKYPNTAVADRIANLRASLQDPRKGLLDELDDAPYLTQVDELSAVQRSEKASIKAPSEKMRPLDAEEAKKYKEALRLVQDTLEETSPGLKAANLEYQRLSKELVNPKLKSVIGRITGKGANETDEARLNTVFSIFDRGTSPGGSEILTLERELRKVGSEATYLDLSKTWLTNKFAKAATVKGGRPSDDIPANIEKVFAGDEKVSQGLKDTLVGMARAQGLPDDSLYQGFQNFLKIVQSSARRPAIIGHRQAPEIAEQAGENLASKLMYSLGFAPLTRAGTATQKWYRDRAFATLDKLVTTPEGIDTLRTLAKSPVLSKKSEAALASFLGGLAARPEDEQTGSEESKLAPVTPP